MKASGVYNEAFCELAAPRPGRVVCSTSSAVLGQRAVIMPCGQTISARVRAGVCSAAYSRVPGCRAVDGRTPV
jgi:hypothetical protein